MFAAIYSEEKRFVSVSTQPYLEAAKVNYTEDFQQLFLCARFNTMDDGHQW